MGVFRQFPYSNFHEMNMDEIIKIVKNMLEEWAQYYAEWDAWMNQMNDDWSNYQEVMNEAWQNMQDFINNYFDNLDVQVEINNKISSMVNSGEFANIVEPYIPPRVTAWLAANITQPVGVVIDTSLSVAGACADAKATGDAISYVKDDVLQEIQSDIDWAKFAINSSTGYTDISVPAYNDIRLLTMNMIEVNTAEVTGSGSIDIFLYDENYMFLSSVGTWFKKKTKNQLLTLEPTAKYMRVCFKRDDDSSTSLSDVETYGIHIYGTKLSAEIKTINQEIYNDYSKWGFEPGTLTATGIFANDTTRLISLGFLPIKPGKKYKLSATSSDSSKYLNMSVSFYANADYTENRIHGVSWSSSHNLEFIPPDGSNYILILFKFSDNGVIVPSDIASHSLILEDVSDYLNSIGITRIALEQGGFTAEGLNANRADRIRSIEYIPVTANHSYKIKAYPTDPSKVMKVSASFYTANDYATYRTGYIDFIDNNAPFTIPSDVSYIRIIVAFSNDANITPNDCTSCEVLKVYTKQNSHVLNANLLKQYVNTEYLGQLTYVQAFCKVNDNYYSIDGTNIAEQNSSFAILRDVALNTGHGNSLQLNSDSTSAFACGWNDNNVYQIDLSTLTLIDTITLPTSGYTTCAVDDINKLMYIFQRTSYPDTETYYNFIVYDYDNEQIISTKKLTNKFGAIQACDFYKGKIAVSYGIGNVTVPSGLCIYNTVGDVLAEYTLDIFASTEPEGVCFDRDTEELLFSLVNKNVYKIVTSD